MKICQNCGHQNPEGVKYCQRCAVYLDVSCPACKRALSAGDKVCPYCGTQWYAVEVTGTGRQESAAAGGLGAFIPPTLADKIKAATSSVAGQKRIVTILTLDSHYPQAVLPQVNEEALYLLERELTQFLAQAVYEYEGHIDHISSQEMVALFGAPVMVENHAERAIQTALTLQSGLQSRRDAFLQKFGAFPETCIGINTGQVIIGTVGGSVNMEYTVVGDTINLATDLARSGAPGTILVSASTHQLVSPLFDFRLLPAVDIAGKLESVAAFEPLAPRQLPGRVRGLPGIQVPMIGREDAIAQLHHTLDATCRHSQGHVVLVMGEAGVGKSRLLLEFRNSFDLSSSTDGVTVFAGYCQAHTRYQPYWIITNILRHMINILEGDSAESQLNKLTAYLEHLKLNVDDVRPFLSYLLGLEGETATKKSTIELYDADMLQKILHNTLRRLILASVHQGPTILIFEDMHWVDIASWTFLNYLAASIENVPLLLVLTSRDSHSKQLTKIGVPQTRLHLQALTPPESRMLVHQLLQQTSAAAQEIENKIAERAAGNPFFIEEIIRMLIDAGGIVKEDACWQVTAAAEPLLHQVPGTLQALILARFDNLEAGAQHTLQKAAVLGMSFSLNLLQALENRSIETIYDNLQHLVFRQFLFSDPSLNPETYIFQHGLVQDAIYSTLLQRQRQTLHGQVAAALESNPTWLVSERDQLLAHHYSRSRKPFQAIPYLLNIGDKAVQRSANETAIEYYRQALDLIKKQGDIFDETYFRANIGLGQSLKFLGQYDEAEQLLAKALQSLLHWSLEAKPTAILEVMVRGLREIADIHMRKAKYDTAISYLEAGIEALGESGAVTYPLLYRALMERTVFVRFRQGNLDEAFDLAQVTIANVNPDVAPDPVILASLFNTLGGIAWQQANLGGAANYVEQSLKLYEKLNYAWGMANVYSNLGIIAGQQGEWPQAVYYWERALSLRQDIGDLQNQTFNLLNLGQMRFSMGDFNGAQQDLERALIILNKLDDSFGIARANAMLAHNALLQGNAGAANHHIQIAVELADAVGGQEVQIEARWIQALITAESGDLEKGLDIINEALQMTQKTGLMDAKSDCLRTVGSLHLQGGNYLLAETHLRESIELSRQLNDPYRQGLALLEMGRIYNTLVLSGIDTSPDWYDRSQTALVEAKSIFSSLGAAYNKQQASTALKFLQENPPLSNRPVGDPVAETISPLTPIGEQHTAVILWLTLRMPATTDEETIFETMTYVLPACATIAQEYGGHVRQRANGLTVTFGLPTAYEDDTERAVKAAYHILEYLQQPENQVEFPLQVHFAISRGLVIAGQANQGRQTDYIVRGEPFDQAQQAANAVPPNQVWVTDDVRTITERLFVYHPQPLLDLVTSPLWQVAELRATPLPARGIPSVQTRFVGRDASLQAMLDLTSNLNQGVGGIIWIEGEAGIGKSRLMREFKAVIPTADCLILAGGCSPQRINHAFSLFADLLVPIFNLQAIDSSNKIRQKIEQTLLEWPKDAQVTQPYLEILAGIRPLGLAGERLNRLEPEQLRQQIFVAVRRLLKSLAKKQPLIIFFDDLHWIDPVSAELLIFIATVVTSSPILFVCAQRREGMDLPNDRLIGLYSLLPGQTLRLMLDRLHPEFSQMLLEDLLPDANLPEPFRNMLVARSDGNPYFIEEFVRMFIEQGHVKQIEGHWQIASGFEVNTNTIPPSLESLIRSRVDALPEELKHTLQCASIIGQGIEIELLATITNNPGVGMLVKRLSARLMLKPMPENNRWEFSHALYESVVYNSMLKAHRKELHRAVAQSLEQNWSDSKANHAKDLAYHYLQADDRAKALPYLIEAGEQASRQHAAEEALAHFTKASNIYTQLSQPNENWRWRIAVGLGDMYCFVGQYAESIEALKAGLASPQSTQFNHIRQADLYRRMGETSRRQGDFRAAIRSFAMAQELIGATDDSQSKIEMARTLIGLAWVYFAQGQFDETRKACDACLEYAQAVDGLNELATAHNLLGGVYYHLGEWRDAFHHTTRAMVLREQMGYSWGVAATLSNLGILAFVAGHWHKAISFFERSLALRTEMGDVEGIAITQNNLGGAYRGQGKLKEAEHYFRESVITAETFNIAYHIANSSIGLAHAILLQGRLDEAEAILAKGIEQAGAISAQDVLAEGLRVRAELLLLHAEPDEALEMAGQAASLAATIGNRSLEAAALRIAAQAAFIQNNLSLAETFITQAEESLAGKIDDLETGHIAAQAYRIYLRMGKTEDAEAKLVVAREIYNRLGTTHLLHQLTQEENVSA